jgi:hypothetical protein
MMRKFGPTAEENVLRRYTDIQLQREGGCVTDYRAFIDNNSARWSEQLQDAVAALSVEYAIIPIDDYGYLLAMMPEPVKVNGQLMVFNPPDPIGLLNRAREIAKAAINKFPTFVKPPSSES